MTGHARIPTETVRRRLVENELKPWQQKMWCIPTVDGEFVARMEDVLELYASTPDLKRPVVCFDETPVQFIGEARLPVPPAPGQAAPLRLRVPAERHREHLRFPRRPSSLATREGDPAPGGDRLRLVHARPRRHPLPRR
jgi:hypothetical protein